MEDEKNEPQPTENEPATGRQPPNRKFKGHYITPGVILGLILGAVLGRILLGSAAYGLGIGMGFGMLIGWLLDRYHK